MWKAAEFWGQTHTHGLWGDAASLLLSPPQAQPHHKLMLDSWLLQQAVAIPQCQMLLKVQHFLGLGGVNAVKSTLHMFSLSSCLFCTFLSLQTHSFHLLWHGTIGNSSAISGITCVQNQSDTEPVSSTSKMCVCFACWNQTVLPNLWGFVQCERFH